MVGKKRRLCENIMGGFIMKNIKSLEILIKKITESRICLSIQGGLAFAGPFTLFGSLILLVLNYFPASAEEWLVQSSGISVKSCLGIVNYSVFSMTALWISYGIGAVYVGLKKPKDKAISGLTGMISFIVLTMRFTAKDTGLVLNLLEAGSDGILTAIFGGLLTGFIYEKASDQMERRREKKKEKDAESEHTYSESSKALELVMESFRALWPVSACMLTAMFLRFIGNLLLPDSQTIALFVSSVIQKPFTSAADKLPILLGIDAVISILDWCGLSGINTMNTVTTPLGSMNKYANQALMDRGEVLVLGQNAAYFTGQYQFFARGAMYTALLIAVLISSRDKTEKMRAKALLVPSVFNISSVIRYTLPVVLRPQYFIPVLLSPMIANLMVYIALTIGFIQPFGAMAPPWTTPYLLYGFLVSGWQGLVLQLLILVVNVLIFLPFVRFGQNKSNKNC